MKAFRLDYNDFEKVTPGIELRKFEGQIYFYLRSHMNPPNKHDIEVDTQNTPLVEKHGPLGYLTTYYVVYECSILERSAGSHTQRLLTAASSNGSRALFHIGIGILDDTPEELQQVSNAGFPQIVDMIGPEEAEANNGGPGGSVKPGGYSTTIGYSYLLIFKPGDAIKFSFRKYPQFGEITLLWDGSQFRKTSTPFAPPPKPTPWKEL